MSKNTFLVFLNTGDSTPKKIRAEAIATDGAGVYFYPKSGDLQGQEPVAYFPNNSFVGVVKESNLITGTTGSKP